MKKVIYECPDDQYDEVKEKMADNENKGVIHRDIKWNEKETNWDTLKFLME